MDRRIAEWQPEKLRFEGICFKQNPTKDKLSAWSLESTFVGYPRETKGFRIWILSKHKIIVARKVRFLEEMNDIVKNSSILDDLKMESTIGLNEKSIESSLRGYLDLIQISFTVSVQSVVIPGTSYHEPATQCEESST